jgi:hypothetical protein
MLSKIKKFFSKFTFKSFYMYLLEDAEKELIEKRKQKHEGITGANLDYLHKAMPDLPMLRSILSHFICDTKIDSPFYLSLMPSLLLRNDFDKIIKWRKAYERECRAKKKRR